MVNSFRPAIVMMALFTLLLGLAYPLAVTGIAQAAFPGQANGSLVRDAGGRVVGSTMIGQPFAGATYLHPRPSAAGDGYDAAASSGSNMGPLNPDLAARVAESAQAIPRRGRSRRHPRRCGDDLGFGPRPGRVTGLRSASGRADRPRQRRFRAAGAEHHRQPDRGGLPRLHRPAARQCPADQSRARRPLRRGGLIARDGARNARDFSRSAPQARAAEGVSGHVARRGQDL